MDRSNTPHPCVQKGTPPKKNNMEWIPKIKILRIAVACTLDIYGTTAPKNYPHCSKKIPLQHKTITPTSLKRIF
jgi:hypothetical protein